MRSESSPERSGSAALCKRRAGVLARLSLSICFAAGLMLQLVAPARGGTVGTITGTVTDTQNKAPIAGVKVTAVAPSGRYEAVTDNRGFFAFTGVVPDTYTVSFERQGYEPGTAAGITVSADQIATANEAIKKSLRTIATVTARNQNGAFQPGQTTDTYTVNATQIHNILGNALNTSETDLIRSLPGAGLTVSGRPSIRGGRTNNVDYEFEGMPSYDAWTNQYSNALSVPGFGLGQFQLTPGTSSATFGNTGVGTINMLAKRGTYPGELDGILGIGGPHFYHHLALGYGFATKDNRLSEYVSFTGGNTSFMYGGPNAPPAYQIGVLGMDQLRMDREVTSNFFYHFGKNKDQSIQFFVDNALHNFYYGYGQNPARICYETCDPTAIGALQTAAGFKDPKSLNPFLYLYPGQAQRQEYLGSRQRTQVYEPNSAVKLEYDWNINPTTYLALRHYNAASNADFDYAGSPVFIQIGGYRTGEQLDFTKQLGSSHLVQSGASFEFQSPTLNEYAPFDGASDTIYTYPTEIYDFVKPTSNDCPVGADASGTSYCGYLWKYFPNGPQLPAGSYNASNRFNKFFSYWVDDTWTPSSKLHANLGVRMDAEYTPYFVPASLNQQCTSLYVPVYWNYKGFDPNKPLGNGNCPQAIFAPVTHNMVAPQIFQPRAAFAYQMGANDAVRFSYGRSVRFIRDVETGDAEPPPSLGAPFSAVPSFFNPGVACLYYGQFNPSTPWATTAATGCPYPANTGPRAAYCNIAPNFVPCQNYGEQLYWEYFNNGRPNPLQPLTPVTYNNFDLSYEHQFPHGWSFKVTPWTRRAYGFDVGTPSIQRLTNGQPRLDQYGNPVAGVTLASNVGVEKAAGLELYLTKESPVGLSGSFSVDYVNDLTNQQSANTSEYFGTVLPVDVALGNLYRVGYDSPFQTALDLAYTTRSGWRVQMDNFYIRGYPTGEGNFVPDFVNGKPFYVPNTNGYLNDTGGNTFSATQYVDPTNPGTVLNPHVAATRGTGEGNSPQGLLTHAYSLTNLTLEHSDRHGNTFGLTVDNLFNEFHTSILSLGANTANAPGPVLNDRYQPVATGVSGVLTGKTACAYTSPQTCYNYGPLFNGTGAYIHIPNGEGRTFYVYFQTKL